MIDGFRYLFIWDGKYVLMYLNLSPARSLSSIFNSLKSVFTIVP